VIPDLNPVNRLLHFDDTGATLAVPFTNSAGSDCLTRTNMQLKSDITDADAEGLAKTLRRVPGVLLVEVDAASGLVSVAHDEAVPRQSLELGIRNAGFDAQAAPMPRINGLSGNDGQKRDLLTTYVLLSIATALFSTVVVLFTLPPSQDSRRWLLFAFVSLFAGFFVSRLGLRKTRP
jgi:hypothetical protein